MDRYEKSFRSIFIKLVSVIMISIFVLSVTGCDDSTQDANSNQLYNDLDTSNPSQRITAGVDSTLSITPTPDVTKQTSTPTNTAAPTNTVSGSDKNSDNPKTAERTKVNESKAPEDKPGSNTKNPGGATNKPGIETKKPTATISPKVTDAPTEKPITPTNPPDTKVLPPITLKIADGYRYNGYDIRGLYDVILSNLKNNNMSFDITSQLKAIGIKYYDDDNLMSVISKAFDYVQSFNPDVFFIDGYKISYSYNPNTKVLSEVTFSGRYTSRLVGYGTKNEPIYEPYYTSEIVSSMMKEVDKKVTALVNEINGMGLTPYEKALHVHDYLVRNIAYATENIDSDEFNDEPGAYNAVHALLEGRSVCEGYAESFQLIMNKLGIETHIVIGTANEGAHEWNIIKLDGEYYHVDVTFDDPVPDGGSTRTPIHTYFNVTDSVISEEHSDWYTVFEPTPKCTATKWAYNML